MKWFLFFVLVVNIIWACNIRKVIDPTPREKYSRNFKGPDSLLQRWQQDFDNALHFSSSIELPLALTARLHSMALGYEVRVNRGQMLVVELDRQGEPGQIFVEIFRKTDSEKQKYKLLEAMESHALILQKPFEETDTIRIVIQSEIYHQSLARLRIYPQPSWLFPVAGKGNSAISSFWGAARDGGKRSHEGVDILAVRGTPLLAVADGRITSAGERGLGGKQVWLRDAVFGHSVYYAHLDSIEVQPGTQVSRGDTLGFVGNTGNAITTVPHLHFGIYTGSGAIDPLLFIRQADIPSFPDSTLRTLAVTSVNNGSLRSSPAASAPVVLSLPRHDTLTILGKTAQWYYLQKGVQYGFMLRTQLKEIM